MVGETSKQEVLGVGQQVPVRHGGQECFLWTGRGSPQCMSTDNGKRQRDAHSQLIASDHPAALGL